MRGTKGQGVRLLGLASDVDEGNIVIDYTKSLFDVYRDVIWFQQKSVELSDIDKFGTVRFSQLVQRSLGGPLPVVDGWQSLPTPTSLSPVVRVDGLITGPIHLLDVFEDNTTSPCFVNSKYVSSIANYFAPDPVGARKGWIEFALSRLERQHAVYGKRIRSLNSSISYAAKTAAPSILPLQNDDPPKEVQSTGHRLFLEAGGNIGLAPGNIRNADLLCQFQNCDIAVIVRACGDRFSIIGRAVVALRQDEEEVRLINVVQEKFYSSMVYSGA
jgi:hypothetical protein